MNWKKYIWPIIGLVAVCLSGWLLYKELRATSLDDVWDSLRAIPATHWSLCAIATLSAYAALAGYDHIALRHLKRHVPWSFVTLASFTTYALSHNIGSSVFSGAVVRYRAYSSRGLSGHEIGILIGLCSLTFAIGVILLTGLVLVAQPALLDRFADTPHMPLSEGIGTVFLLLIGVYVVGSLLKFRPLRIGKFELAYPAPDIVARQLIIGPLEIVSAAAIIYFALPELGNPGFVVVLGVFLIAFSAALLSHAPGGLGVFEIVMLAGLSHMDPAAVMAALLVFRAFYLLIPLVIAIIVVLAFERAQLRQENLPPQAH